MCKCAPLFVCMHVCVNALHVQCVGCVCVRVCQFRPDTNTPEGVEKYVLWTLYTSEWDSFTHFHHYTIREIIIALTGTNYYISLPRQMLCMCTNDKCTNTKKPNIYIRKCYISAWTRYHKLVNTSLTPEPPGICLCIHWFYVCYVYVRAPILYYIIL